MTEKIVSEQFAFIGGQVLRPGVDGFTGKYPVIKDVLLCGPKSLNERDYPGTAFGPASNKIYEGRPIFLNHSDRERQFEEKLGWIENERRRSDGMPIGDIGINPEHPQAKSVLWAAEHKPDFAGFSHVARCDYSVGPNGRESITKVKEIESTDLVVKPATTKGFFESKGRTMNKMSLKAFVEAVGPKTKDPAKWDRWKKLAESEGVAGVEMPEPAADADANSSLTDAIKTLGAALVEQCTSGKLSPKEAGEKLTAYLETHMGKEETPAPGGEGEPKESKGKKSGDPDPLREALAVAGKIGIALTEAQLLIVAGTPAEKREMVAKQYKLEAEGAAGTPTSGARTIGTPSQTKKESVPSDLSKVEW